MKLARTAKCKADLKPQLRQRGIKTGDLSGAADQVSDCTSGSRRALSSGQFRKSWKDEILTDHFSRLEVFIQPVNFFELCSESVNAAI